MRRIQHKNMSLLGTATSGKSLRMPNNVSDSELYEFIQKLPLDEQIDLFCISEAPIASILGAIGACFY